MNTCTTSIYRKILLGGASALAIATSSFSVSAQEGDEAPAEQSGIETIIVTATKRAQNVQDIPNSVQAISGAALAEMGAHNAEDFTRFIPAVSFISSTPGANNVIFRGINVGLGSYIGQAGASVYLDETSITSSGSQPDVRMIDIAGVEALAGPQGTLYGDSAQAGVLRITTNKPNMSETQAILEVGLRGGEHSELSYDVSGVFNLPIVEDKFAIRIVAERAKDGGFINNVLGNTPDDHTYYWYSGVIASQFPDWGTADNSAVAEDRWNGVDYLTARFSAKINMNDNWAATFSFAHQENETNADNGYNPFVGDLQTVDFNPGFREDKWDLYSLVLDGDLGWAQLVSSTSFYKRKINNSYDTTVYSKYYSAWGCYTYYAGGAAYAAAYCLGPELGSDVISSSSYPAQQDKFSQEIRLTGEVGNFDWLVGGYFESSNDSWEGYFAAPNNYDYQNSVSLDYYENVEYPGETFPNAIAGWGSSDDTSWKQYALFGETTWHMSDRIHLTFGARWFQRENSKFYKALQPNTKLKADFLSGPASVANKGKDREFVPKVSLAYDISDDNMVYAHYTKGFRPGGTNRSRGEASRVLFPTVYGADELTNYEIGSKNRFFDNKVQLNFTYYYMKWNDFQLQVVDPSYQGCADSPEEGETVFCDQPWQSVVVNSPGGAHTEGLEADVVIAPNDGLRMGGNVNWLSAKTDGAFDEANIAKGMALPNVPKWKGSMWATYNWPVEFVSGGEMFIRGQYTYKGQSENRMVGSMANPRLTNEAYGIADISAGLLAHDDGWEVSVYVNNIADKRAMYQNSTGQFDYPFSSSGANGGAPYDHYLKVYTNRPREFGMRFKWTY